MPNEAQKTRRRSIKSLMKPYLDAGLDISDLVTEDMPGGGVRIVVRRDAVATTSPSPVKGLAKTDWSDAPAFE